MALDVALLLARLVLGLLFIAHGWAKEPAGFSGYLSSLGIRWPLASAYAAKYAELAGGLLVALGIGGVAGPALIAFVMGAAVRLAHWQLNPFAQKGGWEYNSVIVVLATLLAAAGPGQYSLAGLLGG